MEILVLHPGALGDVILSLPALNLLRSREGVTGITLAGNLDYLAIVPASCADRTLSLAALPLQRLYGSLPLPDADLRFWTGFGRILSWTGSRDSNFAANLSSIHADALVADWRPGSGERRHVSQIFTDTLSPWLPGRLSPHPIEIQPGSEHLECAREWLASRGHTTGERMLALHAGAGSVGKRWPLDRFVLLGEMFSSGDVDRFLLIEGPAETGLARELARRLPESRSIEAASLSLDRLAALLTHCTAYAGNDSGISHLAAAVGIPSVCLFGPTDPGLWSPLGTQVSILRDTRGCNACRQGMTEGQDCLDAISPEAVKNALGRALPELTEGAG